VTRDQYTAEQAPGKPLNGPQDAETPAAGTPGGPRPENGAQTGAESFAPACSCPRTFMRQRGHHPKCPVALAHNAGPSVAECAANDRRWPLEKAGE
jgi:hypothetical protein